MATRAYIGIEHEDGNVEYIYNHFDGFLSRLGQNLLDSYNSREKAQALISDGDCRDPGDHYKDIGDDWNDVKSAWEPDAESFFEEYFHYYTYLFCYDAQEWVVLGPSERSPRPLVRAVEALRRERILWK